MTPLLQVQGITKIYPSVVANEEVDLTVMPGEIHAILGENGAGKSTLMKIIYGATQPDAGNIIWKGRSIRIRNPAHARKLGIGMVFQHFSLFETLTVLENIMMAVPGAKQELVNRIESIGKKFGMYVNPFTPVHTLSVGEQQRVEIIRCLLQSPKLLILDEPTSVLPPQGVVELFKTLRLLAEEGCSLLYISHKLDEVKALCSTATILSSGKVSGYADPQKETTANLARMMIGHDIPQPSHIEAKEDGEVHLQVNKLCYKPADPFGRSLHDVNLQVRSGEIVGIAGVSGNGQSELSRLLSGEICLPSSEKNSITMRGQPVANIDPTKRRKLGFSYVPEERLGRAAVPEMSLAENALLTGVGMGLVRNGLIDHKKMEVFSLQCIGEFDVKCGGVDSEARSLSGGNLQKFIVSREIGLDPKTILLVQPTWGVDVGAAYTIRQRLIDLRDKGVAVLVISEELDELFEITDRLAVLYQGKLSRTVKTRDTTVEEIGSWMAGVDEHVNEQASKKSEQGLSSILKDVANV
ncbi:ABC transporter ATP-binding protein [Dasania marina]|uniref:ABC transporter ATP-binding protein n=1 Tax=Dasania marina TaxID=471499 RepID=UPI0030D9ABF1|tara:strand:- start:44772 stop:46343 length:1572 start_codon:yes stop_codon:yes gene_type:complete